MDGWVGGWMDAFTYISMHVQYVHMDGWMDGWMDGLID